MGAVYSGSYQTIIFGYIIDKGHLMDEYTLLREMAFRIGNVVAISLMILFAFFIPLNYIFILAAISILMLNFVPKYNQEDKILKNLRGK
jgi:Mg2+/citrate symporter